MRLSTLRRARTSQPPSTASLDVTSCTRPPARARACTHGRTHALTQHRDMGRLLPGREDVYIVPQSSCEDGSGHSPSFPGCYYSNTRVVACLVLKAPDGDGVVVPATHGARVECRTAYGANGAMVDVRMSAIASTERVSDEIDSTVRGPPHVVRFTATIVKPRRDDYRRLHRMLELEREAVVGHAHDHTHVYSCIRTQLVHPSASHA